MTTTPREPDLVYDVVFARGEGRAPERKIFSVME
jgi:hypothetical protein